MRYLCLFFRYDFVMYKKTVRNQQFRYREYIESEVSVQFRVLLSSCISSMLEGDGFTNEPSTYLHIVSFDYPIFEE